MAEPRRQPRQERARLTVDALLEATARVVDDVGWPGLTSARVAHVAGVSIGSMYQYFPGKEALFGALIERAVDADLARLEAAVESVRGQPLEEAARKLLRVSFELPLTRPRLFAWILRYLPAMGSLHAVHRLELGVARIAAQLLREHPTRLRGEDPERLALVAVGAVRGALICVAHHHPEWLTEERTFELCTRVLLGSLTALESDPAKPERDAAGEPQPA